MTLSETSFNLKLHTLRRDSGRLYRELLHNQELEPEALAELQRTRAVAIAEFARSQTAFYAKHFADAGIDPGRALTPDDWTRLPLLSRRMLKEHADGVTSSEATPRNSRPALTGGSTGEPLQAKHDARVPTLALAWRMYTWWGIEPWDNVARIARWGFGRFDTLKNDVAWWPSKQRYADAGLMSPESMRQFHTELTKTRPALLEGYVGSTVAFADFIEAEGLRLPSLRAIATTAGPLDPASRARLESVFGVPVHDEYRGSELGWMAGECSERNGLHVFADARFIEVVDEHGQVLPAGETGELVLTDLSNRVFPIIRYRIGDRGRLLDRPCPCGISLPLMAQPEGRVTDLLYTPSGRTLGHRIMAMFSDVPDAVRQVQVHQHADYSVTVRVVEGPIPDARSHVERNVEVLRNRIDNEVPITIEYVDSLPYTGAKLKYVISDVPRGQ
jgi:phenylacetate-CoA ligase